MLRRFLVRSAVLCLSAGLVLPLSAATTGTAHADARVTVTNDRGTSLADTTYQTKLTVRGSGFQTIKGGFGGVYLVFGWVKPGGSWRPSNGGITGTDYRYIPDSESSANQGYMKFIAFPGSSTQGEAQAVLSGSGDFQLALTVPGPVFQSVDRDGVTTTVDCRKVTCGVITIGAHGVKNPRNETFTPVKFGQVYDQAPAQAQHPHAAAIRQAQQRQHRAQCAPQQKGAAAAPAPGVAVTQRPEIRVGEQAHHAAHAQNPGQVTFLVRLVQRNQLRAQQHLTDRVKDHPHGDIRQRVGQHEAPAQAGGRIW